MRKSVAIRTISGLALAALVAACAHRPPGLAAGDIPAVWTGPSPATEVSASESDWWGGFNSPELSNLLATAKSGSFDVQTAALRVIEAEAQATSVGSNLWPGVDFGISGGRRGDFEGTPRTSTIGASLGISYELDLWGRLRASNRAAVAQLAASRFDRATVDLTVASGVADAYLEVLAGRDRLALARSDLDIALQVLTLVEARANAGVVPPLDLAQQQAAVARQRAAIPPLEQQERAALSSLALLLGRSASSFNVNGKSLAEIAVPAVVPGLPSELLSRRPDVASAKASLVAASANLDAARAALLPSIALTGSTGLASAALKTLIEPASAAWSLGASLGQSIFDAGARGANVRNSRAREQELLLAYRKTVLTAFSETDLALFNIEALAAQRVENETELGFAREAYRIAQVRYKAGGGTFDDVLQAQSALFSAEDSLNQLKLSQAEAAVTLFRALGGGWRNPSAMARS
jgi:NodT family efflux transporter outer membrane factor (OMF) lipoprotein